MLQRFLYATYLRSIINIKRKYKCTGTLNHCLEEFSRLPFNIFYCAHIIFIHGLTFMQTMQRDWYIFGMKEIVSSLLHLVSKINFWIEKCSNDVEIRRCGMRASSFQMSCKQLINIRKSRTHGNQNWVQFFFTKRHLRQGSFYMYTCSTTFDKRLLLCTFALENIYIEWISFVRFS